MLLAGCGGPSDEQVGPVTLDVPGRWVVDERDTAEGGVLEQRRWHPEDDRSRMLQVIVGCGDADDDADDLRRALAETYRVHDELQATEVDVSGLDSAQRVSLALTADPFGDTAGGFLMDGLYGAVDGGLVVVELGSAEDEHDPAVADQVFGSVEVDAERLVELCAGG